MRDQAISLSDLNQLRLWIATQPEVPEGDWYKDFGSFKICGHGSYPKTFLLLAKLLRRVPITGKFLLLGQPGQMEQRPP